MINSIAWRSKCIACLLIAASMAGCVKAPPISPFVDRASSPLPVASGFFYGVAWIDERSLALSYEPDPEHMQGRLFVAALDGSEFAPLQLTGLLACGFDELVAPSRFQSGGLTAGEVCIREADAQVQQERRVISVRGDRTIEIARLTETPDEIAWFPSDEEAIMSAGNGVCESLARIVNGRQVAWDLLIQGSGRRFNLSDKGGFGEDACNQTGRAEFPAVNTQGRVAFFASPQSVGVVGQSRLDQPWSLFALSAGGDPQVVVDTVESPHGLAWSGDGQRLVFSGAVGGRSGIWSVNANGEVLTLLSTVSLGWFALNPNNDRIAGITLDDHQTEPKRGVVLLDGSRP